MKWDREDEFKELLEKAVKKGSKAPITAAQHIAVEDMAQCYKHVCALVERQMRKAKPAQRLNAFFLVSSICRHSTKKYKLENKYTKRWAPNIAEIAELLQGVSAEQMVQAEKVLASWRKEKIFPDATVELCAVKLGLPSLGTSTGITLNAAAATDLRVDPSQLLTGAASALPPPGLPASPANSLFSEPSAGSIDAAVLDAFPPKTVASANIDTLPRTTDPAAHPASHASTGSSRPPEPPNPIPPPDLYDPFQAESDDYAPLGLSSPVDDSAHALPPLPIPPAPQGQGVTQTGPMHVNGILKQHTGNTQDPHPALPPPLTATPKAAPHSDAQVSRKRKSRWEDAPAAEPRSLEPKLEFKPEPTSKWDNAAPALKAERKSKWADPPAAPQPVPQPEPLPQAASIANASSLPHAGGAPSLPAAPQQADPPAALNGSIMTSLPVQPADESAASSGSMPAGLPVPPAKPASARASGEAQAAAALLAVQQVLQARRPVPPTPPAAPQPPLPSVLVQQPPPLPQVPPPLPQSQPPLPPPLPPQLPFAQLQPGYQFATGGPSLNAPQPPGALHTHAHQGWPPMPHMGHMQPQQHQQPGLLQQQHQHLAAAAMHQSPLLQQWPPQHHAHAHPRPPQLQRPAPPLPHWGATGQGPLRTAPQYPQNGPIRASARQAPKFVPDVHFQDESYAQRDRPAAVHHRTTADDLKAVGVPSAPPSPPSAPPSPPPPPVPATLPLEGDASRHVNRLDQPASTSAAAQLKPPWPHGVPSSPGQHIPKIGPALDDTPTPLNGAVSFVARQHNGNTRAHQPQQGFLSPTTHDVASSMTVLQQNGSEPAQMDDSTQANGDLAGDRIGESRSSSPTAPQPQTAEGTATPAGGPVGNADASPNKAAEATLTQSKVRADTVTAAEPDDEMAMSE